jgi:cytochrome P450
MQDKPSTTPLSVSPTNNSCPYNNIGANFDPTSTAYVVNPYPLYTQARQSEPIFFSPALNAWMITRYDDIKTILHDPRRFSSFGILETVADYAPATQAILEPYKHSLTNGIVNVDPPQHTRFRASLTKTFSARGVAKYEPLVRWLANQLIDQFIGDGRIDLFERFNYPFPALVIFNLIGVPEADLEQVQAWCKDWTELLFSQLPPERQVECAHSAVAYQRYIDALIEQRRSAPQNDFTSDLIAAMNNGEAHLSQEELFSQIVGLVFAGNDTTASFLGNCLYRALNDRSLWQYISDDPKLIPSVVEETMRIDGAAFGFFRTTTEVVEIGSVTLPKDARVIMLWGSANHDETWFPDPEAFNLQRQNLSQHLGFGAGIHFCLGAPLVRMEARIALELLSTRLPSLRLIPDQELSYKSSLVVRGLTQLLVEWDSSDISGSSGTSFEKR